MSKNEVWRLMFVLLLGQLLSLAVTVTTFISSYLADLGVDAPLTQSFFSYLSLALVYGAIFLYRGQKLLVPWYWYLALAIFDVQANYLVVKAFQYTSIMSVTLLDCWTIPWVIILTWTILGTRYSLWKILGAIVCVLGLGLGLLSDAGVSGGGGRNLLLGDFLVIVGTLCFAFSNVGEEFCVKKKDRIEVIAMLGVFGVLVSLCEISIFERKDLASVIWSPTIISLLAVFVASTFLFYSIAPFVLKMSGSTLFNLSLLTSDMWAVLIRIFLYHQKVDWLYYLAFGAVAIGLIIYSFTDTSSTAAMTIMNGEVTIEYEALIEESLTHETESISS